MKKLESQVLKAIRGKEKKGRYTFTLSPWVKEGLAQWCRDNDVKESAAIEEMILKVIPDTYFEE